MCTKCQIICSVLEYKYFSSLSIKDIINSKILQYLRVNKIIHDRHTDVVSRDLLRIVLPSSNFVVSVYGKQ